MSDMFEGALEDGEMAIDGVNEHFELELHGIESFTPHFIANIIDRLRNSPSADILQEEIKIDSLSGAITKRSTATLSNGKLYDVSLLAEYILQTADHRDPHSGYRFLKTDLEVLSEGPGNEDVRERILNAIENENLPSSPKTSAIKFFQEAVSVAGVQLALSCELTSISTLAELQKVYERLWITLTTSLCALVVLNPLTATSAASKLQSVFNAAVASCDDPSSYIYEQSAIVPIASAIQSLVFHVGQGVLRGKTNDILRQIQIKPTRLLF